MSSFLTAVFLFTTSGISYGFTAVKKGPFTASAYVDIDTDGDGLGDTWERNHFGSLSQEGSGDYDGDGFSNLWEYRHGTDPVDENDPNFLFSSSSNALNFLKDMMDRNGNYGRRILYSYIRSGATLGYGWTYDNAISVIALEERGEWQRAKDVLDAYIWFQENDPIGDGRIRRAYFADKPIPQDISYAEDAGEWIPFENSEASNQSIGDMAFMILAALRYHEYIGGEDSAYINFAKRLGDWVYNNAASTNGAGGYNMARRDRELADPANFDRKSTENNIDAYVAFIKLYEALGDHTYRMYALHAKNFVLAMWNEVDGMFWTGTLDDGITINGGTEGDVTGYDGVNPTSGQPEDVDTWALLALGEAAKYEAGINWVENSCRVENRDGFSFGYDFNADTDGIWFEGTCHVALSRQALGDYAVSDAILNIVMQSQDVSTGGIPCASHDGVTTSFSLWTLNSDLHISPAAWFILSADGYNPFWGQAITDPVPYEGGYNETGDKYIFDEPWVEVSDPIVETATDGTARAMVSFGGMAGDDKGTFDAGDDGKIVKYEWDFDGKGIYDWSSYNDSTFTYWYTEAGAHLAKLKVTNEEGYTAEKGVTVNISREQIGTDIAPPALSDVTPSVIAGPAPLTVSFAATGSDSNGYVAHYEWDFDGDGEYDSYSAVSGDITHTYRQPGVYEPTVRITDDSGLTDTAVLAIEVSGSDIQPHAKANARQGVGSAPYIVSVNAAGSTGAITTYEWDFEGNGNWIISPDGKASYTYREAGTYHAALRVTDINGLSDTDAIEVRVRYNDGRLALTDIADVAGGDEASKGIVPLDITFVHLVSGFDRYEWDFDGDKRFDISRPTDDDVAHGYTKVGYYLATVKVTDDNGLAYRGYLPIAVAGRVMSDGYVSRLITPEDKQTIYGNTVTFAVEIFPNNSGQDVNIEYRLSDSILDNWIDLVLFSSYPYRAAADVTALADPAPGVYDFRAPVNTIYDNADKSIISVSTADWDINESTNIDGEHIKKVKIKSGDSADIILMDGTRCAIPLGALDADDIMTIIMSNDSGRLIDGGARAVLYHREFTLAETPSLNKPITITIPYDDINDDGIVDGLGVPEEKLALWTYNEATEGWEPLADYTVYGSENYVSGPTSHLSVFGLGGSGDLGPFGGNGGSSGGSNGGTGRSCFIATATFGTPMAEEVQALRLFRDTYLLTNSPGEFLIDMYEKYSPPIAKRIEKNEFLKGIVRFYLRPIITFARWANAVAQRRAHSRNSSSAPRGSDCGKAVNSHD